jgi:hypothetical protein
MGQRKNPRVEAEEDRELLPPPRLPVVVNVGGERIIVALDPPTHEASPGTCRCGGCPAAALAEHYRFV